MPWGKLDDSLYDHPKLDGLGRDRLSGVGLWSLAISWCNKRLTDGHLTADRVRQLGGTVRLADRLVDVGLFERAAHGYLVHDFLDFNDSRADVERRREAERDKKKAQRAAGARNVGRDGDGRFVSPEESRRDTAGESPATRPDPTRPDPSSSLPPPPAERGRRNEGTNPRASGSSPRQNGGAPRQQGTSPRQEREERKRGGTESLAAILARAAANGRPDNGEAA